MHVLPVRTIAVQRSAPSCSTDGITLRLAVPVYTTQRSTRYVLPISITTYGSSYINLLALWKNRTSIYSALYRTVHIICCWTNQVLWAMHILRSWLLQPFCQWCISWLHYDPADYRERRALRAVYFTSWCTPPKRECVELRRPQPSIPPTDLRTQWSYPFSAPAESEEVE